MPCQQGCVGALLDSGMESSKQTRVKLEGQSHSLTCVPVADVVVCMLNRTADEVPESWQLLTTREQEVLELLAAGETTTSEAQHLRISQTTIRTHVEKMRLKLGVHTRAALVALGFRHGYLD